MSASKVTINTDGGSRGNPGKAAVGVVIKYGSKIKEYGEAIGHATNNVAEYSAVIFALKKAKQLIGKKNASSVELSVIVSPAFISSSGNTTALCEEADTTPCSSILPVLLPKSSF